MKYLRHIVGAAGMLVAASAVYILWADGRRDSLLALALLTVPMLIAVISTIALLPKVMDHPAAFGWDSDRAVRDVVGNRREWLPYRIVMGLCTMTAGVWMIYHGNGMRGCGEILVAVKIANTLLNWIDTTKPGRNIGKAIGLPLTPDEEIEVQL